MEALANIAYFPPDATQVEIANRIGIERATLTRMLDTLEADGLIERLADPADRRTKRIRLTKAGEAGNATAMYDLSRIFALGSTGSVDEAASVEWLRRAAENGHPAATYQLGTAYLEGAGVAKDRGEALRWLERSKAAGNLLAARTIRQAETADPQADVTPSEGE